MDLSRLWTRPKQRVKQDLERKYGIKQKGIHTVIEIESLQRRQN